MKVATPKSNANPSVGQNANSNSNAYLRTKVLTASPAELRLLLFEGAIRFAQQARTGLLDKDYDACYSGITRCQAILMELINGLKPEHEPDLCEKLAALYTYMYMQLVKASTERDVTVMDEVLKLLQYERDTWVMLLDRLADENRTANGMTNTPDAQPPAGSTSAATSARKIIGGTVSVRG